MLVTDQNIAEVCDRLMSPGFYSLDTETSGLNLWHNDRLFSIIISDGVEAYYFDFKEGALDRRGLKFIQIVLNNKDVTWFMHNAKFDLTALYQEGLVVEGAVHCTEAIGRVEKNNRFNYKLETLAKDIGDFKSDVVKDYIKKHKLYRKEADATGELKNIPMYNRVPLEVMQPYAEQDALVTWKLGMHQIEAIENKRRQIEPGKPSPFDTMQMEQKLTSTCFRMEQAGIRVDRDFCRRALKFEQDRMKCAKAEFQKLTGSEFVDSAKALAPAFDKVGERYPTTDKGNPSFTAEVLGEFTSPLARLVLDYRNAQKRANTYFANFLHYSDANGYIHANIRQGGTETGRFCIAKGTYIEMPRDLSKNPNGILIEDIKQGDMVYCYDENRELDLKKVVWAGKTGHKKIIRLHWLGQGRKKRSYLDLTPEHEVRLIDGTYARADSLKVNQSVLALGRSRTLGYARLHSRNNTIREHRFIYEKLTGNVHEHVHHIDDNKLNNIGSNLQGLTAKEHTSLHSKLDAATPGGRKRRSEHLRMLRATGVIKPKYGEDNHFFKKVSRYTILKEFAKAGGSPTKLGLITDFSTAKNKLATYGISFIDIKKRYGSDGRFISKGRLKSTFGKLKPYSELSVGHGRYKELCVLYGFKPSNHVIKHIEYLEESVDVYDLEVEEHHNFIANEICVHNSYSNPNLQNLPKRKELKDAEFNVRRAVVPSPGNFLAMVDFTTMEYRLMLDYAGQMDVVKQVLDGIDLHQATANLMGVTRDEAKTLNFMLLYGGGIAKLCMALFRPTLQLDQLKEIATTKIYKRPKKGPSLLGSVGAEVIELNLIELRKAEALQELYFEKLPRVKAFTKKVIATAGSRGWVKNWAGRICLCENKEFAYAMPNHLIQGGCADVVKYAMIEIDALFMRKKARSKMIIQVHDELVFDAHPSEIELIAEAQKIMETTYTHKHLPMTCEADHSFKSWADKVKGLPA